MSPPKLSLGNFESKGNLLIDSRSAKDFDFLSGIITIIIEDGDRKIKSST